MKLHRGMVCALVLVAATAAEANKPPKQAEAEARERYKRGMTHYDLGEFDAAIEEFKQAYALTQAPGLLFNLAQACRKKRDWDQALHFYRSYLRLSPHAPNRKDVEKLVAEVEHAQQEERERKAAAERAQAAAEPSPAPTPPPRPVEPVAAPQQIIIVPQQNNVATQHDEGAARAARTKVIAGVTLAVAGLAVAAGGIYAGVRSSSDADELGQLVGQRGAWSDHYQSVYDDGQRSALAADVLIPFGAVVAVTGVALAVVGWRQRLHVALAPVPGGAVLGFSGATF